MADIDVTRIAGNIGAMNSLNALSRINKQLSIHQTRLSTGKRINSAADDPAGLTIATKMQARSEGLKVALNNIGDAKNLLAVAEAGLGRINDILVQMRNKAEAGASDTMGTKERAALVSQMTAYATQIDDIVAQTKWTSSSPSLIDGTYDAGVLTFQTGSDSGETTTLTGLKNMEASAVDGLNLATSVSSVRAITGVSGPVSYAGVEAPSNANLEELASGQYIFKVDYGTDGTDATVQLFKADDAAFANPLLISDGVTAGSVSDTMAVDLSMTNCVLFGNGVHLDINGSTDPGTASGSFSYTRASTGLELQNSDGATIDGDATAAQFAVYMNDIQLKLDDVSEQLSKIGALTGRLSFKEDQVSAAQINTEAAYNRIMNADMAEEQVNASKYMILQQTATAMLAQANAAPQFLLSLFR
jgi:flagellin